MKEDDGIMPRYKSCDDCKDIICPAKRVASELFETLHFDEA